jgi:replicative DNA helicase
MDELRQPQKAREPLFTGWPAYDATFGPFISGESVIIGARSSIGKTAAMLQTAIYQASHGRTVLFASLEMTAEQVRDRIMCGMAAVDATKFRSRNLGPDDMIRLDAARKRLDGWPLMIWCPRGKKTVARVAAKARAVKAEHGLRLLCIDYLGKLHAEDSRAEREEQVASFARGVKDIATDLDIPVVTGSQLSRKADSDDREIEPSLHHLRDSGAVEQEADIVIFVHRRTRSATEGKFIVAKFRQGTPGELQMVWNPMVQEFTLKQDSVEERDNYDSGFDAWNRGG